MYEQIGPPGHVIEKSSLKGLRIGGAEVSRKYANFIVNLGSAKTKDILELIGAVRYRVLEETGFCLMTETHFVLPSGKINRICDITNLG